MLHCARTTIKSQDDDREQYQRPRDVLKALEISAGDWAADVGAGNGYYAKHMADLVGPAGRVFAEDITDDALGFLQERFKSLDLHNVEIIKGTDDDPKLPPDSLAAVLIINTYHHFLVTADYSLSDHRNQSRALP